MFPTVKEFSKSINSWQSRWKKIRHHVFWDTV